MVTVADVLGNGQLNQFIDKRFVGFFHIVCMFVWTDYRAHEAAPQTQRAEMQK